MKQDKLKSELTELLTTSGAHADFDKAIKGFPLEDAGKRPKGVPWSAWQLLEHMHVIARPTFIEYVSSPICTEQEIARGLGWPKKPIARFPEAWSKTVKAIKRDRVLPSSSFLETSGSSEAGSNSRIKKRC